jgi:hypothetical protein
MIGQGPQLSNAFDDEEDTSLGDMFDHLTPREVSIARYQQNHEWMEELLSSPYRIGQIVYPDLGLGLQGELAPLTEGIFEAPGYDAKEHPPKNPYVGRLDAGLADEFRKRVAEKVASTEKEIEQMQVQHEKMMNKFKSNSVIKHAEKDLRVAVEETGPEFWRLEGRVEEGEEGVSSWKQKDKGVEDIVASVESALGRHARVVHDVMRIQDGGYQEPVPDEPLLIPPPVTASQTEASNAGPSDSMSRQLSQSGLSQTGMSQNSGVMIGDSDIDMGGTAAGMLDQMNTGLSATSTPNNLNFPTPQMAISQPTSAAGTPAVPDAEPAKDTSTADSDWVVVPKGGVSPTSGGVAPPTNAEAALSTGAEAGGTEAAKASPAAPTPGAATVPTPAPATSKPASAAPTPGIGGDSDSMALDGNDFGSLGGDLDTAGEALAGYEPATMGGTPSNL